MHAKQHARAVVDGALVVGEARAVGGADFAKRGAAFGHDVRNAEAVADFDELSARDDDFAAASQRGQNQKNCSGVVVDHDGGFGSGQAREQTRGVDVASTARARLQIVFQVGVMGCGSTNVVGGFGGKRRAAEIGVQDHSGGVDDGPQGGAKQ